MNIYGTIVALGLVNWIVTTICVESEITRPIRDWLTRQRDNQNLDSWNWIVWDKFRYLAACHLCSGTWIGFALAAIVHVRPIHASFGGGFVNWVLASLLIKAIGHMTLVLHKAGEAMTR